jgi:Domain of unknown function (DUF222)
VCVSKPRAADLHGCLDGLLGADDTNAPVSGAVVGADLAELVRARHRLDAVIQRRLAVFDGRGLAAADGVPSTAAWLRGKTRISGGEASGRVKTARLLGELPATAAALAAGQITLDHARAIASLATDTDVAATRAVEEGLVAVARLVDPARLAAELADIRDSFRNDGSDRAGAERRRSDYERRRFAISSSMSGMFTVGAWMTAEGGALFTAAVTALSKPLPGDTRTATQRRHDAVVELARLAMGAIEMPEAHGARPTLLVNTRLEPDPDHPDPVDPDLDTVDTDGDIGGIGDVGGEGSAGSRAEHRDRRPAGNGGSSNPGTGNSRGDGGSGLRFGPGFVPGGGIITRQTVQRLACDADDPSGALRPGRGGARPRPGRPHGEPGAVDRPRRPRRRLRRPRP